MKAYVVKTEDGYWSGTGGRGRLNRALLFSSKKAAIRVVYFGNRRIDERVIEVDIEIKETK